MTALITVAVVAGIASVASRSSRADGMPPRGPAPVKAITLSPRDVPVNLEYAARVRGSREVEIRPRVSGILEKRNYREGAEVKAGQSLFTIDPVPYRTAVARAEADLAAASARLAQARREAERLRPLIQAKAASRQDLDNAESGQQVARAEVQAAEARLREARLNLEYTRVESPLAGIAGRAIPSEGALLAGPESLLTRVIQVDPVHVLFGLPDSDQLRLQRGAASGEIRLPEGGRYAVELMLSDGGIYTARGQLDYTSVRVDEATGTSEARAVVANPDGLLRPGQFVRVRLSGAMRPQALQVPQRAVLEGPQGRFVYIIEDGKAAIRPVELAETLGEDVVVTHGLASGDQVIVDGVLKIGPGAPVTATPPQGN
ncbi:MAG: efflux RND transporter periplasmic adaptor subunit [Rhodocyclaceae bacterium]|nr:efflux RND transporter periplasmic adaptor subunit [Rhodocyclaceae bacterium]